MHVFDDQQPLSADWALDHRNNKLDRRFHLNISATLLLVAYLLINLTNIIRKYVLNQTIYIKVKCSRS